MRSLAAVAALVTLGFTGAARSADQADRSTLEAYATWANGVVEALPDGVRQLEPLAQRLVELASERRDEADEDLAQLEPDPELLPAALAHALDVLERDYAGHVTPEGLEPGDRVALLHRRLVGSVGENLAELEGLSVEELEAQIGPLAAKIMDGLMQSPGHRENILDPAYTHLAIAAAAKGEQLVVVQLFEARRALLAQPLPLRVDQDQPLPLAFEQGEDLAVPAQYAYARPGQSADALITLDLSIDEVPVEPGAYFLKFLFPTEQEGHFQVADGPAIFMR